MGRIATLVSTLPTGNAALSVYGANTSCSASWCSVANPASPISSVCRLVRSSSALPGTGGSVRPNLNGGTETRLCDRFLRGAGAHLGARAPSKQQESYLSVSSPPPLRPRPPLVHTHLLDQPELHLPLRPEISSPRYGDLEILHRAQASSSTSLHIRPRARSSKPISSWPSHRSRKGPVHLMREAIKDVVHLMREAIKDVVHLMREAIKVGPPAPSEAGPGAARTVPTTAPRPHSVTGRGAPPARIRHGSPRSVLAPAWAS